MFFSKEEIIDNLNCPRCQVTFEDPRNLPCGETVCFNCTEELKISNDKISCFFCGELHKIPSETGFKSNKFLSQILSKTPRPIYRGEMFERLKNNLDKLKKTGNELELSVLNHHSTIIKHCAQVRNHIDFCAEEQINEINTIRIEYIAKINEYEKQCLQNIEKKHQVFDETIQKSKKCIEECNEYLKSDNLHDESLKRKNCETEELNDHVHKKLASLRSVLFNRILLNFKPNKPPSELKNCFGSLEEKPLIDYENSNFRGELFGVIKIDSDCVINLELMNDDRIVTSTNELGIQIWNIESCECVKTIIDNDQIFISCLKCLDEDTLLAIGFETGHIKIYNLESGDLIKILYVHVDAVRCIKTLRRRTYASCSDDRTIKIFNTDTGEILSTLEGHAGEVTTIVVINEERIASGSHDNSIIIWDIKKCEIIARLRSHKNSVMSLTLLQNGYLASCSDDKKIKIWNAETGQLLKTLSGHTKFVSDIVSLKNGYIASASGDETIRIWDPNTGETLKIIKAHDDDINSLKLFNYGYMVSVSFDNCIKIWH